MLKDVLLPGSVSFSLMRSQVVISQWGGTYYELIATLVERSTDLWTNSVVTELVHTPLSLEMITGLWSLSNHSFEGGAPAKDSHSSI